MYRYLHILIPSLPNASMDTPRLVLRIRQNPYSSSRFSYSIVDGNDEGIFRVKVARNAGELQVVKPLIGPWEGVVSILTKEISRFRRRVKTRMAVVYVFVYENQV